MSIFICNQTDPLTQTPDLNSILAQNKFNGYGTGFRNTPGWINVDFSDDNAKIYPGINYYLVFNATAIESFEGDNYFDLYTTNFNNDTTQNSKKYESDLNWPDIDPQKAALFRLKTDQYEPTDLTEITVNVSIFNSTGGQTVKSFDPTTNSSYFDENSDEAGPWGEGENVENLVLFFEANYTCRFQYSFDINITQTKTSKPCSFTTHFNKSNVEWETWINATAPEANSGNSKYNASTMNYTVFFPGSWFHFNGTAPENNFTSSMDTPKLYINSSVSRLNWTFRALSPYEVGNITTVPQNRIDFSPGMNITCKVTWNSTEYNASLSFWNITKTPDGASGLGFEVQSATYLDYHENVSRSTSNQSYSHTFPNYTIPLSYTAKNISVKVWWHNQTSAGIFLKTFKIKNNASLVNYTYFEKVGNNQNLTLKYEYLDNNSDPIPNAQISSNWENENWSYSYNITEGAYYIEIHVFKPVGDDYLFGINFSHPDYISRLHEVKIRVLVGTSLILKQGSDQDQIYMNDTLELGFAWYTDTGERISKKEEDPNRNFNITFDGGEINNIPGKTQWIFDHKQTNPNSPNLFITINTRFLDYKDYIDNHNVSLSLLQENATTSYKVQKYTFYFEIKEIPSYLSLYSSNAYQMQKGQKFGRFDGKIVEFENYKENIRLNILYEHNGTHLENMNELVPFNWGELSGYVEDKDLNKKVIKNIGVDSIYDGKEGSGLYFMEFPVSSLIAGHNYELHIICQDTNIAHKDLNVELDIISRWQVRLDLVDIISKTEGEMLTISGQVNFENASDVWNAANQKISIKIQFINDTGVMTEEILTFTESNGSFSFTNWKVPNRDHYQFINISVSIAESRTHHSVSKSIQIEISENIWTRYVIPILITALSLLFGIPLVMKYGVPFFKKRIEKSILIQKARENPKIRNAVNKVSQKVSGKDAFIAPSDKPKVGLDAIKTVKIPRLPDDLNSFSKVSPDTDPESFETDEVEIEPEKKEEEVERTILDKIKRFNTRIKKIQDIFSPKKTQETMLEAKNDNIYKAKLLEENQEYLNAIIHYYFAQEYARRLELDDEVVLLENMMNKLLVKMDAKDQLKFIKKYKVRAEKERKS